MTDEAEQTAGTEPEPGTAPGKAPAAGAAGNGADASGGTAATDGDVIVGTDGEPFAPGAVSAPGPDGPVRTSRRFPLVTRDTARPEGGGRAAAGDAPAPARQWPLLLVLCATGVGLLVTALGAFREGTLLVGIAMLAGAVMRWTLPNVGMLAVRSRFTDLLTYGGMGLVITLLALMIQPNPLLKIPFLEDALHFTIA